jgi:integrase
LVSLAEAREMAASYRKLARDGGDPLAERRKERRTVPSFQQAARRVHAEHAAAWKNAKHAAQWLNTLVEYVFPGLGDRRVDYIDTPDVLKVLSPIWLTKPETARRVRQRIGTVLDWAKAAGFRTGENPVAGVAKGLPKQFDRDDHHAALPYAEVPKFIRSLRESDTSEAAKLAFEFLILTATRTGEVLGARWPELDFEQQTWTIPAKRMKSGRQHTVPLSVPCLDILARAKALSGSGAYVFPGRSADKPLSNMVFLMTLRRMGRDVTTHGFRSSFRDWASERTSFPREVCEQALAHVVKDKTEAAYRRGDLLEKRRELMASWAAFATSAQADVIPLRAQAP